MNTGREFRDGCAISSRVGGSEVKASTAVVIDRLAATHKQREVATNIELMTQRCELLPDPFPYTIFDEYLAAYVEVAAHGEPGGLHGGL